jgi:hypothetical protein
VAAIWTKPGCKKKDNKDCDVVSKSKDRIRSSIFIECITAFLSVIPFVFTVTKKNGMSESFRKHGKRDTKCEQNIPATKDTGREEIKKF